MAASVVLISRFPLDPRAVADMRSELIDSARMRYLIDSNKLELLQLRAYDDVAAFAETSADLVDDWRRFAPFTTGDVRRELVTLVDEPKPVEAPLPGTDFIQLRHIEVPPLRMASYHQWREQTIFQIVRENNPVEAFLAYHSLVSGQPGVMFIAGFSGDPAEYQAVFDSERYREIVRQAGDNYIVGGSDALYTRLYLRPQLLAD
ncbi:hypothetical protein [Methylosinus sporium]|uniref:hypothetical protein n=1 Tax=Methylosinus sporium TaxID=428 RepID=UPI00132FDAD3|nr:hypothetical protein [Methylosinus sporium]